MTEQLSIRTKVLLSLCILSVVIMAILVLSFYSMTFRSIKSFELENADMNIKRVNHEINILKTNLSSLCNDWSAWDDTYVFIEDKNQEFIDENLNDKTISNIKTNVIVFLNNKSEVVHVNFLNPLTQASAPFPDDLLERILKEKKLLKHNKLDSKSESFFLYSEMPVLLISRPIRTSNYTGPIKGTLIFGRIFSNEVLEEFEKNLGLNISVLPGKPELKDNLKFVEHKTDDEFQTAFISIKNTGNSQAYIFQKDSNGLDSFALSISIPREFATKVLGEAVIYFVIVLFSSFILLAFLLFFIDKSVLSPLFNLSRSARNIASKGDFSSRLEIAKGKEFGLLSTSLNEMLESLEKYYLDHMKDRDALMESEAYLARLLDAIDCGVISADMADHRVLNINQAGMEMTGYSKEEIIGRKYSEIISDVSGGHSASAAAKSRGVYTCEGLIFKNTGVSLHVLKSITPLKRRDGEVLIISFVDISILKATEEMIRKNEAVYREFFEQDLTGDFISDPKGRIIECNIAFANIFGYDSVSEIMNIDANELYILSESRTQLLEILKKEKKLKGIKWTMRKKNGDPVYLIGNIIGVFDDDGVFVQMRGYLFDETERIMLEKALRQAYKMEAIGTLAGGIAHDFNNILSAIMGHAELCQITTDPDSAFSDRLEKIIQATKRAKSLVKQILTFSTRKEIEKHTVEVGAAVKEALNLVKSSIPSIIEIRTEISSHSSVSADPNHIHQIVINICTNAMDAMSGENKGILEVAVDDVYLDNNNDVMAKYGDYVRISISDTGHGMTPDTIDRIFDPFFTTRQKLGKTGMGLSVVHGIIKSLDGAIRVESEPGEGALFEVFLPLLEVKESVHPVLMKNSNIINLFTEYDTSDHDIIKASEHSETGHLSEVGGVTEENKLKKKYTVLVVEDEAIILEMLTEMIKNMGFSVIAQQNPLHAIEFFKSSPESVDIVMTDLSMPEIGGEKLSEEIFSISPYTPVVICSGFSSKKYAEEANLKGPRIFLKKPIVSGVLSNTLKEICEYMEKKK
ncbi:CHASE4 domain-containing protein [Desulforegula conservatrix]|uniref:CHASE4 domain-containing protein n=1 Tax=Desulforegula conservatrix TaxID=153026 RepID=UPI0004837ED2|nr:CHASE4 domain-containing protein [Desulforegula conservatrix]